MKWWPKECKSGDMIRIKVGSIYHYGIFVSESEVIQFGNPPGADMTGEDLAKITVHATDIDGFSKGNIVEVAELDKKESKKRFSPEKTVALARERIGSGNYSLLYNNCEHFVNECVFGEKRCSVADEAREKMRKLLGTK